MLNNFRTCEKERVSPNAVSARYRKVFCFKISAGNPAKRNLQTLSGSDKFSFNPVMRW